MGNETEIGKLVIRLTADLVDLRRTIAEGTSIVKDHGDKVEGILGRIKTGWLEFAGMLYVAQKALNAVKSAINFSKEIGSLLNDIERTSAVLGLSTDEFQEWQYVAKMSDVNLQELQTGFKFLSKNMEGAAQGAGDSAKYFQAMGISVKDAAGNLRPLSDVMLDIMDRFEGWKDGARKLAISMVFFGRSGETLIPFLNKGRSGFKELAEEAQKLGIILDPELIKKGSAAEDIFKKIDFQIQTTKLHIGPYALAFAMAINSVLESIRKVKQFLDDYPYVAAFLSGQWGRGAASVWEEMAKKLFPLSKAVFGIEEGVAEKRTQPPVIRDEALAIKAQQAEAELLLKQAQLLENVTLEEKIRRLIVGLKIKEIQLSKDLNDEEKAALISATKGVAEAEDEAFIRERLKEAAADTAKAWTEGAREVDTEWGKVRIYDPNAIPDFNVPPGFMKFEGVVMRIDDYLERINSEMKAIQEQRGYPVGEFEGPTDRQQAGQASNTLDRAFERLSLTESRINREKTELDMQKRDLSISRTESIEKEISLQNQYLIALEETRKATDQATDPKKYDDLLNAISQVKDRLHQLGIEQKEQTGTIFEGMSQGWKEFQDQSKTAYQVGRDLAKDITGEIKGLFSEILKDGKITMEDLKKSMLSIWNKIMDAMLDMWVDDLLKSIKGSSGGISGGGGGIGGLLSSIFGSIFGGLFGMAQGGSFIASRPTLLEVGEGYQPELVSVIPKSILSSMGGMGGRGVAPATSEAKLSGMIDVRLDPGLLAEWRPSPDEMSQAVEVNIRQRRGVYKAVKETK